MRRAGPARGRDGRVFRRGIVAFGGARQLTNLVLLIFGLGLSASAFEFPGGLAGTTGIEPATRLVYSGPMPPLEEPVATLQPRPVRLVLPEVWVAPPIRPEPASLPDIPDYELISDAKVATIRGQPLVTRRQFDPPEPEETAEARPFMTRLPTPGLAAAVSNEPEEFCGGFC